MVFQMIHLKTLFQQAKSILEQNWRGTYTIPTSRLYPFQWNWDSGFVAIGWAHFDLARAMTELESLFSGQWENGMVPHIIFHSENEKTYFPNYDFWNANVNPGAPTKPKTSGITQPAVHGFVLEQILKNHGDNPDVQAFAKTIFPKIVHSHRWLYQHRDPNHEGLFCILHPWESGRDNSPLWDEAMDSIEIDKALIGEYTRRDTAVADPSERPTHDQYDRYVYLLQLGKKHQYDGHELLAESPFLIQDSMMNAILIKSNQSLIEIGKKLGLDTAEVEEWQQQSVKSFNAKMWHKDLAFYTCYDVRNDKPIAHREIGGLVPLFGQIPDNQKANILNDYLINLHKNDYYLCPSFDVESPLFDSKRYWRGPIWPQMNWMIYHGLKHYNFDKTADIVRSDFLELIQKLGFYEYFESQKSQVGQLTKGYGGGNFSWTASSVIDFVNFSS